MPELRTVIRSVVAGTSVGGLLVASAVAVAHAQPEDPPAGPDNLVSVVAGGTTTLDSVALDAAVAAVTELCGGDPAAVLAVAQQVDVEGGQQTLCTTGAQGDILITQNVAQESAPPEPTPAPPAEMEIPPIPGEEEEAEPADTPAIPGEGTADEPFSAQE
ncbi:hypothetical protein ACAG25_08850 [Mycobacterium sp. pV006]|uniref:hypothetical protein n=1 Tax=Mycobacterium sp. pV006 TaxID=3238983 RepID=UPI00351B2FF6